MTTATSRPRLRRQAILLQAGVVLYNVVECLIALIVGRQIGSVAMFGFGVDGVMEIASSVAVLVYLKRNGREEGSVWEPRVARLIGLTLLLLALYIFNDAMFKLIYRVKPDVSYVGIALAAASLLVMTRVARVEHHLARQLDSVALAAEARETLVCARLSAALLLSLLANALFGLWWVDPAAGLFMATLIAREGIETWNSRLLSHEHEPQENLTFLPPKVRSWLLRIDTLGLLELPPPESDRTTRPA